jgi:hypothetical protein
MSGIPSNRLSPGGTVDLVATDNGVIHHIALILDTANARRGIHDPVLPTGCYFPQITFFMPPPVPNSSSNQSNSPPHSPEFLASLPCFTISFPPGWHWQFSFHPSNYYWPSVDQIFTNWFREAFCNYLTCLHLIEGETQEERALHLTASYHQLFKSIFTVEVTLRNARLSAGILCGDLERELGNLSYIPLLMLFSLIISF